MSDRPHILLVDASGFCHRAFYANAAMYRQSDGLPIWATIGFMGMLFSMLKRAEVDQPTHGVAVFDAPGPTFRKKLFPGYKASRPQARRAELLPQQPYLRHAAEALGLTPVEKAGFEADDVICTYANMAAARGWRVTLVSSDKDFCQCVRDGVIEIIEPMTRSRVTAAGVKARFGVPPDLVPDVQALWGDSVDDIPGIEGIGGKQAGALIRQFGGLEKLLKACGQSGTSFATPAIRKALRQGAADARLYKKLATLVSDVKDLPDLETLTLHKPDMDHLKEMLKVLGESRRFGIMFGGDPSVTMKLPHVPAPLQWWHAIPKPPFPLEGMNNAIPRPLSEIPNDPQDGFFKTKLVKGGPWIPARIWRDREVDFISGKATEFDIVKCEVAGKPRNPLREWMFISKWPITKQEFDHRSAVGDWAKNHAPDSPEANPKTPVNWLTADIE